jgi:hypothetical protein
MDDLGQEFLKELYKLKYEKYLQHGPLFQEKKWEPPIIFKILEKRIKEFFPMNQIPTSIIQSMKLLDVSIKIAENELTLTVLRLIKEVSDEIIRRKNSDTSKGEKNAD